MPCRPSADFAQGPEPENDGAKLDDPDAEEPVVQSNDDEDLPQKQKRTRHVLIYEVVKRWVTGERAVLHSRGVG